MNAWAKAGVYWPGITNDVDRIHSNCASCNRTAPSQPCTPPIEPCFPTILFEALAVDYFHFQRKYYFVVADRLSGWTETQLIKMGTEKSGAEGLCMELRRLFITFGVPAEISSDGGPEFSARVTENFLKRWGVRHQMSSAYFPSSNGRAELAVKATKRLLMDNVGPNGELDTDKFVRAMQIQRNTPDPGCKLAAAEVLFGRPLRDTLPFIDKGKVAFCNSQFSGRWREAWKLKEDALRARYAKTLEDLNEHSRLLTPLQLGEHVFLQNQCDTHPKKWDRSGVVVEVKTHDQYLVKVSGSGQLTVRNRRFLRKFILWPTVDMLGNVLRSSQFHLILPILDLRFHCLPYLMPPHIAGHPVL